MKNWIGNFIHNCIAHPLMPFLPKKWSSKFHDWTIIKFWPPQHETTVADIIEKSFTDEDTETMDEN